MTPIVVTDRAERLRSAFNSVEAMVIVDPHEVRWLTGFTGSAAAVVIGRQDCILITDGRYVQQAREEIAAACGQVEVVEARTSDATREKVDTMLGTRRRIGADLDHMTARWLEFLVGSDREVIDASELLAEVRRRKDPAELERIERACRAADAALNAVSPMIQSAGSSNVSERDIRDELEYRMRQNGADGPSYDTIVAAGENAARPHHRPTSRQVRDGDCLLIDVGAIVEGYHSDMTRTFLVGEVPIELRRIYGRVYEVQERAVSFIKAGVTGGEVDAMCRLAFGDDADLFIHGTGHGVGTRIHESPWLRAGWNRPLEVGDVVTVEPGLYRVGLGGVRIEDLVVVEPTSCRTLTLSPKDPPCPQ